MTKTETLIPRNREMSTTARLLLVAQILEEHPERHNQEVFVAPEMTFHGEEPEPTWVAEHRNCGTAACVAGWAVASSPPALIRNAHDPKFIGEVTWESAGARALGIDYDLASLLFDSENTRPRLIKALRVLAQMSPAERTYSNAWKKNITPRWLRGEGRADKVVLKK
jgi:hypothetical protein